MDCSRESQLHIHQHLNNKSNAKVICLFVFWCQLFCGGGNIPTQAMLPFMVDSVYPSMQAQWGLRQVRGSGSQNEFSGQLVKEHNSMPVTINVYNGHQHCLWRLTCGIDDYKSIFYRPSTLRCASKGIDFKIMSLLWVKVLPTVLKLNDWKESGREFKLSW